MKKLVLLAAFAGLSACGGAATEEAEPTETTEVVTTDVVATTAADGGPSTGTFMITDADGKTSTEVVAADGTFVVTRADGEVREGIWEQRSPNEYCAQLADETEMTCYSETVNEEGVWTSTDPDDGEVSTVERVVGVESTDTDKS